MIMTYIQQYKYIILISFLCCAIIALLIYKRHRRKKMYRQVKARNSKNRLRKLQAIYLRVRPLARIYKKIQKRMLILYPTELIDVSDRVTKSMTTSLLFAGGILAAVLIFSQGDIFFIGMGITVTYMMYHFIINSRFEMMDNKLHDQFQKYLPTVKSNFYAANKFMDTTLYRCIDDCDYEMSLHAQKFYDISKAIDMKSATDRYIAVAPNRFFLLFIAICTTVSQFGDKIINGKSVFIENLRFLQTEVHMEHIKLKRNKTLFSCYTFLTVLPLFCMKLISWYMSDKFPEVANYYTGFKGILSMVAIFVTSMVSYRMVLDLKDTINKEPKEHEILNWLSNVPVISKHLVRKINRNYSKAERFNDKLKLTGEGMGCKQFYLQRYIFAIVMFILSNIILVGAVYVERNNILNEYEKAFATSYVEVDELKETMADISELYVKQCIRNGYYDVNPEELQEDIIAHTSVKKPTYVKMISDVVIEKVTSYGDTYFKWYYLIFAYVTLIVGYNIPVLLINNKAKQMKNSMEDEVNQFQTLAIMLMHEANLNVSIILEWMERFSFCFKDSITTCIINLPYGEEKALENMRNSESFEPFKRFVNSLMLINESGPVAAFSEIKIERENNEKDRELDIEAAQKAKSAKGLLISIMPLAVEIYTYLFIPMFQLMDEMSVIMNSTF